jgi:hypothetical protein
MEKLTPIKAIKKYCKESCCCRDIKSWKHCTNENCPLFIYRLGKRPKLLLEENITEKDR